MTESTVTAEQLNDLRQRFLQGKPWTRDELKAAITSMIGDRIREIEATAKPAKASKVKVSLDDLL